MSQKKAKVSENYIYIYIYIYDYAKIFIVCVNIQAHNALQYL